MLPPDAVSVTLFPEQNVVGPFAVICATGKGSTLTFIEAISVPQEFVTATVYVPAVFTVIAEFVELLLQRYVPPPDAVSVTLPPVQNDVGPFAVICATGRGKTVTLMDAVSVPQVFVTATV